MFLFLKGIFGRSALVMALALIMSVSTFPVSAQKDPKPPELSVSGIRLGDRESAKKFLADYSAGYGDEGQPEYSFWNKFGNQVMKVSARSFDDPYFITKIEVFYAPQSYMGRHYILKDKGFFVTENGIFIGYRQSAVSIIVGIPNVAREDRIGPNDIVRKKGEPTSRTKEDKTEVITYRIDDLVLNTADRPQQTKYMARYETSKNKLRRFSIEISSAELNSDLAGNEK